MATTCQTESDLNLVSTSTTVSHERRSFIVHVRGDVELNGAAKCQAFLNSIGGQHQQD